MARSGINYEDVKTTAHRLVARGLHPSIQRVREALGTGSNSTIAGHLKRWQQEVAQTPETALPASVPETVLAAVEQFWQVAADQADRAYQKFRQTAEEKITAAEQDRHRALAETRQLHEKIAGLAQQLSVLESECKETEKRLLIEREKRRAAEQAIEAAEQRAAGLIEAAEQSRESAEQRVKQLAETLEHARQEAAERMVEAEQRLQYERERGESNETRLMLLIDQSRTDHEQACQRFESERQTWKRRETESHEHFDRLQQELSAMRQTTATLEERNRGLVAEQERLRAQVKELETQQLRAARVTEALRSKHKFTVSEKQSLEQTIANCCHVLAEWDNLPTTKG